METGRRVRFTVLTRYKGVPHGVRETDVWSSSGMCGSKFLTGETYLVYAQTRSGRAEAGSCSRTQRLTDAGDDLAYLHFLQAGGFTGRLFGFATHDAPYASAPVRDLVLELGLSGKIRLAGTGKDGELAFDGLAPGEYTLQAFDLEDYYEGRGPLADAMRISVRDKACIEQPLYIPEASVRKP